MTLKKILKEGGRLTHTEWVIVSLSFITIFLAYGTRYCFSVFYVPITTEFEWSRAISAMAYSINMLVYGIGAVLVGFLVDRFHPKRLICVGTTFLAAGLLFCSQIRSIWHFYMGFGVILALGICALGVVVQSKLLSMWFKKNLGTTMGLTFSGMGLGMVILLPLLQHLIIRYGWRWSFVYLAALIFFILFPLNLFFLKDTPPRSYVSSDRTQVTPPEEGDEMALPVPWPEPDVTLQQALRRDQFWLVFFAFISVNISIHLILVHQIPYVVEKGFTKMTAAAALGTVGLFRSVWKFLGGLLSDRIGRGHTYLLGAICGSSGILLLLMVVEPPYHYLLFLSSLLFGMGYGIVAPIFPALTLDLFSGRHYGKIYGFITLGMGIGSALGPWLGGVLYDNLGGYEYPLILAIIFFLFSGFAIEAASVKRDPRRSPEAPLFTRNPSRRM